MKIRTKILLAFVALLGIAVVAIPLLVNANTFRPAIEKQLTIALGRNVRLGDLRLSLFSGVIVATNLSIADDPDFSAAPFLTARELRIHVAMRPLIFSRQVKLLGLDAESPQIILIRAANGMWNFSSIGHAVPSSPPGGAVAEAASKVLKGSVADASNLAVKSIVIRDGQVSIESLPTHGRPSVYEHVNFTTRNFSFASRLPVDLSANLPAEGTVRVIGSVGPINRDDVATSPADLQVSVKNLNPVAAGFLNPDAGLSFIADINVHAASDGETLATSGTGHVRDLRLRESAAAPREPFDFTYSGTHSLKENTGRIEDATVKIRNAELHAHGTYQAPELDPDNPLLNLKLVGQNLPVDGLQPLLTAAAVRLPDGSALRGGTLSLNLAINGRANALTILGPIALDNTHLVGFDVGSKLHGIAALSHVKTGDTTDIEKLRVNIRITNADITVDDIDAVIPAIGELTGNGTVSPADQLDFKLIAKITSAKGLGGIGVKLLTKLNGSGSASRDASGVPLRVIGTPDNPYITADVGGIVKKKTRSFTSLFHKKQ